MNKSEEETLAESRILLKESDCTFLKSLIENPSNKTFLELKTLFFEHFLKSMHVNVGLSIELLLYDRIVKSRERILVMFYILILIKHDHPFLKYPLSKKSKRSTPDLVQFFHEQIRMNTDQVERMTPLQFSIYYKNYSCEIPIIENDLKEQVSPVLSIPPIDYFIDKFCVSSETFQQNDQPHHTNNNKKKKKKKEKLRSKKEREDQNFKFYFDRLLFPFEEIRTKPPEIEINYRSEVNWNYDLDETFLKKIDVVDQQQQQNGNNNNNYNNDDDDLSSPHQESEKEEKEKEKKKKMKKHSNETLLFKQQQQQKQTIEEKNKRKSLIEQQQQQQNKNKNEPNDHQTTTTTTTIKEKEEEKEEKEEKKVVISSTIRALIEKSLRQSLSNHDRKILSDEVLNGSNLIFLYVISNFLTTTNFPTLVHWNMKFAQLFIVRLIERTTELNLPRRNELIDEYLDVLSQLPFSLSGIEVFNVLIEKQMIEKTVIIEFLQHSVIQFQKESISGEDKRSQFRKINLLTVFIHNLLTNEYVQLQDILFFLKPFCIEHVNIKGCLSLLKMMEG